MANISTDFSTWSGTAASNQPDSGDTATVQADLQAIQAALRTIFPSVNAAVTPTHTELNYVDGVTSAIQTQLDSKATLSGGTFTGDIVMSGASIIQAEGAAVTAAATTDIWATDGNARHVTGNTTITSFGTAPQAGARMLVIFDGTPLLTQSANLNLNAGGLDIQIEAGDWAEVYADTTTQLDVVVHRKSGAAIVSSTSAKIQPIDASVSSNALTITINPTLLDFRSATLSSGTVNTRTISAAISMVVSSGSTLGTINGQLSRIAVLAIDNSGTVEVACVNTAGGNDLSETGLISTTAEGGAGGADSATVFYSTTARTNVPYRVVGYIEATEATAGTWATAPSQIQGVGGNAVTAMSGLGHGQTYSTSHGKVKDTTYYNTTGKPITVVMNGTVAAGAGEARVNGLALTTTNSTTVWWWSFIVPPGQSYGVFTLSGTLTVAKWAELS